MGQKLQDGKKVLEMSQLHPHSKTRPVQTIHPTDLGLLPYFFDFGSFKTLFRHTFPGVSGMGKFIDLQVG